MIRRAGPKLLPEPAAAMAAKGHATEARMSEIASNRRKPWGRPFVKGQSGNPAGRRPGSRNRATLIAEILLQGQSEALMQKAVERALEGSDLALKLCLDRNPSAAPRADRVVRAAGDREPCRPRRRARGGRCRGRRRSADSRR